MTCDILSPHLEQVNHVQTSVMSCAPRRQHKVARLGLRCAHEETALRALVQQQLLAVLARQLPVEPPATQ